ncbi:MULTISPECIES: WXG100 family type VII secretion target [Streptomyces]|uniref:ESAT-6-like protein n=2 Tax=Streptomyces TaxID=1883 RepID=A0AAU1U7L7_9ACTN|nr:MULTISPECIES: WXG100 family type VII secretion target [unclassified Streptomyces]MCX4642791.1 WXG100 family type VII secretion target [Streptomyces sp. NBC_01446]MCX5323916.1 WXG100 family type VII secretion target [Streptomyces sp. NBC_00120]
MGMNHDELVVKYGGLDATATELGTQAKRLEADLAEIKQAVANVAGLWEGEAHEAYARKQAEWDREARGIHAALESIGHKVHQAGGDYMGGDKKAASYFE